MVWLGTNYNTIAWSGTKCDIMTYYRLPFVTLSFGYGIKCNNLAVTTTNAHTSAKCDIAAHNIYCTKCITNDLLYQM